MVDTSADRRSFSSRGATTGGNGWPYRDSLNIPSNSSDGPARASRPVTNSPSNYTLPNQHLFNLNLTGGSNIWNSDPVCRPPVRSNGDPVRRTASYTGGQRPPLTPPRYAQKIEQQQRPPEGLSNTTLIRRFLVPPGLGHTVDQQPRPFPPVRVRGNPVTAANTTPGSAVPYRPVPNPVDRGSEHTWFPPPLPTATTAARPLVYPNLQHIVDASETAWYRPNFAGTSSSDPRQNDSTDGHPVGASRSRSLQLQGYFTEPHPRSRESSQTSTRTRTPTASSLQSLSTSPARYHYAPVPNGVAGPQETTVLPAGHQSPYGGYFTVDPDLSRRFSEYQILAKTGRLQKQLQIQACRSSVLARFHRKHGRFELNDVFGHVVEFCGNTSGSRFLQDEIPYASCDSRARIFSEIYPNAIQLMEDQAGNFVMQLLFQHGIQAQKTLLVKKMKGHVLHLSMNPYGCRVVQSALSYVLDHEQAELMEELHAKVPDLMDDRHGNHVIQVAIQKVADEHVHSIIKAHHGRVYQLSKHVYGCRTVQRILEHRAAPTKRVILDELRPHLNSLIADPYGNYVLQAVIKNGEPVDRTIAIQAVLDHVLIYATHVHASNVVEKAFECGDEGQREAMLQAFTGVSANGASRLGSLLRDSFGNYVIQKCLPCLEGPALRRLVEQVEANLKGSFRQDCSPKRLQGIERNLVEARRRLSC